MKKQFKEIALFMAFLMLITSCYTYRHVPTSEKYNLQVDDKVKITAEGIEYAEGWVTSVNDSTVVIRQGNGEEDYFYNTIRINKIDMLHVAEFNGTNTGTAIGIPLAILLLISLYFILDIDDFVEASK